MELYNVIGFRNDLKRFVSSFCHIASSSCLLSNKILPSIHYTVFLGLPNFFQSALDFLSIPGFPKVFRRHIPDFSSWLTPWAGLSIRNRANCLSLLQKSGKTFENGNFVSFV